MRLCSAVALFCCLVPLLGQADTNRVLTASGDATERMKRMAQNLMRPLEESSSATRDKLRSDWLQRFNQATAATARMEIVTESAQIDDPETVRILGDLLKRERDPLVRRQIEFMFGFFRSTPTASAQVCAAMREAYLKSSDADEKTTIVDVVANLRTPESLPMLCAIFSASGNTRDKIQIAAGLYQLAPRVPHVDKQFTDEVIGWLKEQAKKHGSATTRLEAARVLAAPGQDNKAFLRSLAQLDQDPGVRKFCVLASAERPTE